MVKLAGYVREADLVASLARALQGGKTPWGRVKVTFEFDYVGGHADVLALGRGGEVIAFEAKLSKWREALHQAYRTRCFAARAYVVVPARTANLATRHQAEFQRRRVGLCSVSDRGAVEVLRDADADQPLQPWMTDRARAALSPKKRVR